MYIAIQSSLLFNLPQADATHNSVCRVFNARELFWPRSHKRPTPLLSFINILRDLSFLWFATTIIVFIRRSVDISIFKAKFRKRCLSVGHVAFFGFRLCYWSKVRVCALSEPIRMRISLQPVVTHISTSVACVSVINYNTARCVRSIKTWQWFCQCPVSRTCDTLQNIYGPNERWTCPVGHVNYQFDLPSHDLYLPWAVGQVLMSTPVDTMLKHP